MSKDHPQTENMKALEQSLNDHMEICRLKRKVKRFKAENARLKAEVERLRASSFVTAVPVEQYERLIKAGDDMAFHYQELVRIEWGHMTTHIPPSVIRWNAAKEGKPIV